MSVEDRLAIIQKIAEYSYTFDGKDAERWSQLFTEDGIWESILKEAEEPTERLEGRSMIRDWAARRHGTIPDTYRSFHHQSGTLFDELTDHTACTRTMLILTGHDMSKPDALKSGATIAATGIYFDDWRKTEEGWLISRRVLVL
jgi:hypothetical protein